MNKKGIDMLLLAVLLLSPFAFVSGVAESLELRAENLEMGTGDGSDVEVGEIDIIERGQSLNIFES